MSRYTHIRIRFSAKYFFFLQHFSNHLLNFLKFINSFNPIFRIGEWLRTEKLQENNKAEFRRR